MQILSHLKENYYDNFVPVILANLELDFFPTIRKLKIGKKYTKEVFSAQRYDL